MGSYNLESGTWDVVPVSSGPLYRYGHSLALYQVGTGDHFYVIRIHSFRIDLKLKRYCTHK